METLNSTTPTETSKTLKIASIKKKKQPVIKAGYSYHYDPATYNELHKVPNWHYVYNTKELVDNLRGKVNILVLDTETKSLGCSTKEVPPGVVRRYVKKKAQDVPFGISLSDGIDSWYTESDFLALKELIEDPRIDKELHNAKFDYHQLMNLGMEIKGKIWDSLVILKLLNENLDSYALKDLAQRNIDKEANKWEIMKDNWLRDNKTTDWTKVPKELMGDYGAGDTWWVSRLLFGKRELLKEYNLEQLYDTESKLIYVLARMERRGFMVDRPYLETLVPAFEADIDAAKNNLYAKVGNIFNANSSQQLYKIFLEQGVDKSAIAMSEAGNPVLDKFAMEALAEQYPIANEILEVRRTEKLLGTYIVGVLTMLDYEDRVHGNWNQTEATTGRMSATEPNLQNLPKKDKRIRSAYIPRPGFILMFFDLDQVEYRLFAHYSRAQGLIAAIKAGKDVHTATAALIFHIPYDKVTEEQRSTAKTMNFALIYGQGDAHTARSLKLDIDEARCFKRGYFADIPEAKPFLATVEDNIKRKGYVRNFFGRRRHLSKDEAYKGPNALIQGCAADFIKRQMVSVDNYLVDNDYESGLVNIVHDELILEVKIEEVEIVAPKIKELIDDYTTFRVPITCGCEFSLLSWGKKLDYDLSLPYEDNAKIFNEKYGGASNVH